MAAKILISHLNPVRLFELANDNWDYFKTPAWETGQNYCQKWEKTDTIRIHFAVLDTLSVEATPTLALHDGCGDFVSGLDVSEIILNAAGYNWYEAVADLSLITAGKYLLVLGGAVDGATITFYSEPVEIAADFENTLLFEYTHDENDFDLIFVPGSPEPNRTFYFRVEGGFASDGLKPSSKDSMYIDQTHNAQMLSSVPFDVVTLTIGNGAGVPNWIAQKINRIFSCNSVIINGVAYCKNEGAKMEAVRGADYASAGWKVDLVYNQNYSLLID